MDASDNWHNRTRSCVFLKRLRKAKETSWWRWNCAARHDFKRVSNIVLRVYQLYFILATASSTNSRSQRTPIRSVDLTWFARARLSEKVTSCFECRNKHPNYNVKCKARHKSLRRLNRHTKLIQMSKFLSRNSHNLTPCLVLIWIHFYRIKLHYFNK